MSAMLFSTMKLLCFLIFLFLSHAAVVEYDWNVTWVRSNPDNAFDRPTMGINGHWPLPVVEVNKGDRLLVHVHNQLGNQSTSIHFHGLYQNGTTDMDGVVAVTQCGIAPGSSFTYNFTADQVGTYWYHSHVRGQYPDGLRGSVIIHDPEDPFKGQYDEEVILTLSDWYHDQMQDLMASFISVTNPSGAEPVPDAALMNDTQNATFAVQPGKTYMFHIVNIGGFAAQYFWFEGHKMRIVEVDGIWTEPADADMLYVTVAQRYSVLVTTHNDTTSNFAIVGSMDQDLFDTVPDTLNPNVTSYLVYDQANSLPTPTELDAFNPFDDFTLVPLDKEELYSVVDHTVSLDMKMDNLGDGANYAFFNDVTYVAPKVPTLYTTLTSGSLATNQAIYGPNTNTFVLGYQQTVEVILNNLDTGKHPFHLHGHNFQVVARSNDNEGSYANNVTFPTTPMRRDTLLLRPQGNFVIRFKSDNPGIWLFHCHIEWHVNSGLIATMVEAPLELQSRLTVPPDHYAACRDSATPYTGNAAGNTQNLLDLTGANASPAPLPDGFTPRGIVAMTFSILSALLGIVVIGWYGSRPISVNELSRGVGKAS